MILELTTRLLVPITFVYALIWLITYLFKRKATLRNFKPLTAYEKWSFYFLLLLAGIFYYAALNPPSNFFSRIGAKIHYSPRKISSIFNSHLQHNDFPTSYNEYMTKLFEVNLQKDEQSVYNYFLFGDSVINCKWCRKSSDYFMHSVPAILLYYLAFFLLFGLFTTSNRIGWRFKALAVTLCFFAFEALFSVGIIRFGQGELLSSLVPEFIVETFTDLAYDTDFTLLYRARLCIFSFLCLNAAIFPATNIWTPQEILIKLIDDNSVTYNQLVACNVIKTVTSTNELLKSKCDEMDSEARKRKEKRNSDAEFRESVKNAMLGNVVDFHRTTIETFLDYVFTISSNAGFSPELDISDNVKFTLFENIDGLHGNPSSQVTQDADLEFVEKDKSV